MKMICAMLLAGAFLISRPVMADDAPKPEKAAKASKKDKKKDTKADDKTEAPAPGEKKSDKGGW
jgi:hypothetical protein